MGLNTAMNMPLLYVIIKKQLILWLKVFLLEKELNLYGHTKDIMQSNIVNFLLIFLIFNFMLRK